MIPKEEGRMEQDLFGKCPFATAQKLIQGKWAILILHHLSEGPVRFNELQRRMPPITHATLSAQLKQLETGGLIMRTEYPQIPPKVEYALTEIGQKFAPVLESIRVWGNDYIAYLDKTDKWGKAHKNDERAVI